MTAPGTAAARFGWAFALGLLLGLWYGFLRPLRPKYTALADGTFLLGAMWAWLYLAFGVCGGDLRVGYLAGAGLGGLFWEMTLGQVLRRPFAYFWGRVGALLEKITIPLKKILYFTKILVASGEKWGKIKWNNRRHSRRSSGGKPHGRIQKSLSQRKNRIPPQQSPDQGGGDHGHLIVYGGADYPGLDPQPDSR